MARSALDVREEAPARAPDAPSPWSKRRDHAAHRESLEPVGGPISLEELHEIAEESSRSERRADDAERDLMEWKKVKFMERSGRRRLRRPDHQRDQVRILRRAHRSVYRRPGPAGLR